MWYKHLYSLPIYPSGPPLTSSGHPGIPGLDGGVPGSGDDGVDLRGELDAPDGGVVRRPVPVRTAAAHAAVARAVDVERL